ncbi:MAG TPA: sulfide/dihydroorotate dehydrogenase-like FAD/NAD-binding protein [Dehalococcoidia bacterium]|nr:sulfide/dihydroorotate dehydrogenase-like FAD/NAD-binding protein [Dehalococcoidia bacterium]
MFKILLKENLVPNLQVVKIEAPEIAKKALPGQFVIIRVDEYGERIPMTIAEADPEEGSITVIFMEVGTTTGKMASLKTGDYIENFTGPLGVPAEIEKVGTVLCIGGCYGIGGITPIARAMKEAGNKVISIIEGRSKRLLYWQDKLEGSCDELVTVTGDDSDSYQEWISEKIDRYIKGNEKPDLVIAVGCTFMMRNVAEATKDLGIKTIVHLSPIMVDGTGMCGCCRVEVGGTTKFACVDGPEFDAHEVEWDLLVARQVQYLAEEIESLQMFECTNWTKV